MQQLNSGGKIPSYSRKRLFDYHYEDLFGFYFLLKLLLFLKTLLRLLNFSVRAVNFESGNSFSNVIAFFVMYGEVSSPLCPLSTLDNLWEQKRTIFEIFE